MQLSTSTGLASGRRQQETAVPPPHTHAPASQGTATIGAIPAHIATHVTNSSKERLPLISGDVQAFSSSQERLVDKASLGDRRPSIQAHGSQQPSPRAAVVQPPSGYLYGQTDKQSSRGLPSTVPTPVTTPIGGWIPIQEKPSPDIYPRTAGDLPMEDIRNVAHVAPHRLPREGCLPAQVMEHTKMTEKGQGETVKITHIHPELKYQIASEVHQPTFVDPRTRTSSRPQTMDDGRNFAEARPSARGEIGKGKDSIATASDGMYHNI